MEGNDTTREVETTVYIAVTDSNDHPPLFDQPLYNFNISENVEPEYLLGVVSTSDADGGADDQVCMSGELG